ncbi:putative polyprotein [Tanacetum coccineum]
MIDALQAEMFMMRVYPKTCISLMNEEINKTENVVKPELLTVVEEFDDDFALLTELPPKRDHDHKIPLVEGIQPVKIRPYRHPPIQKDAIESIVKELSELDLRPGYHQIRMLEDDIAKTAFKTHEEHYEFIVMPFGLTNAPSTFQALMNDVFKAYLRKFILSVPTNIKQLRGFLGLTGYYRKFIKDFASLTLPDFTVPFEVETNASGIGIRAVLQQKTHPITYWSKALAPKHQSLSIYNKMGYICDFEESLSDLPSVKDAKKHYNWSNGQLLRKNKLVVGKDDQLRLELLAYFHGSSIGGHSSVKVTTHKYKPDLATYPDLLQRLPIPNRIQESISMDFIEGLPKSQVYGQTPLIHVPYFGGLSKVDVVDRTLEAREQVCAPPTSQVTDLPSYDQTDLLGVKPIAILDKKMVKKRNVVHVREDKNVFKKGGLIGS